MQQLGRTLLYIGLLLAVIGGVLILAGKLNLPLGRLPGDVTYHKKNLTVFAPFGTMIIVSVVLTIIFNIISKWMR